MGKKRGGRGGRGGGEGRGEVKEGEEMEEEEDEEEEFTVSTFVRLEQRGSKFLSFTKRETFHLLQLYARFSDAPQEPGKAACLALSLLSLEVSCAVTIRKPILILLYFLVLGTEPRALYLLGKYSIVKLNPQPQGTHFNGENYVTKGLDDL